MSEEECMRMMHQTLIPSFSLVGEKDMIVLRMQALVQIYPRIEQEEKELLN